LDLGRSLTGALAVEGRILRTSLVHLMVGVAVRTASTEGTGVAGRTVHWSRQAHPVGRVLLPVDLRPVLVRVLALAIEISWGSMAHFQCVEAVSCGVKVIDVIYIQTSNTRNYQLLCDNQDFNRIG
jgi:hypothetical protein